MIQKIVIGVVALVSAAYLIGYLLSSSNISTMAETCNRSHSAAYCSCKEKIMRSEVSPLRYLTNMRAEGMRIVGVSTGQCS